MFENLLLGIAACFTPTNLLAMLIAVPIGIIVGALPGFGAATGLIIVLPLTYTMDMNSAFVMLTGVYLGAEYGGSISSILINTPGTGGAVVTCFDGHPMARQGKAREALLISNIASFTGGIVGALVMFFFLPILGKFALKFGAGEIFVLAVVGLLLVGSISKGDPVKGIASAAFGVLVMCIGADAATGHARFYFNSPMLIGGLPYIPLMLGLFSIPYLLNLALSKREEHEIVAIGKSSMTENLKVFSYYFKYLYRKLLVLMIRSGLIGVLVGIIPGVGAAVSTMVAYSTSKKLSKHPEEYGTGCIEGLATPESCNNGIVGGSLIPVIALGIPGSPSAAIFMSAIFMHGLAPGPNFMANQGDLVYLLIAAVFIAAVVQLIYGALTVGFLANLLKIPNSKLVPAVIVICSIGAYVVRGLEFDIFMFAAAGIVAFFLFRLKFNLTAIVLGMILGTITESALIEGLTIASAKGGILPYIWTRPIMLVMLILLVLYLGYIFIRAFFDWKSRQKLEVEVKEEAVQGSSWKGIRKYDAVFSPLFFIGCALLLSMTYDFPGRSGIFPRFVLFIMMACFIFIFIKSIFIGSTYKGYVKDPFSDLRWGRLGTTVAAWIIYLALLNYIGFFVGSLVFVFATTVYFSTIEFPGETTAKTTVRNAVFSILFVIAMFLVFKVMFSIQLPSDITL